jgi:hypothetical protein
MQKKQELDQKKAEAGLVSESYPNISGMVIQMTYYQRPVDTVLMLRTVNVFPHSYAYFHMQCMVKGCSEGGFDLTRAVKSMIRGKKKKASGKIACHGQGEKLPKDHASIAYKISIKYRNGAK